MKSSTAATLELMVAGLLIFVLLLGGGYEFYALQKTKDELAVASSTAATLTDQLASTTAALEILTDAYTTERGKNGTFESTIDTLSGTLDKLKNIDPQLLAKYSKIYFLNENYKPSNLTQIPGTETYGGKQISFLSEAWPFLDQLLAAAAKDGIDLKVLSGYRSFGQQETLKTGYKVTYGVGANAFSADQGYSEHQLGTAVDFTTTSTSGALDGFEKTPTYKWLLTHAYTYGFVISYPQGNSFYQYEPWHWRFVGHVLASHLHTVGVNFYDLDQKEINNYLSALFD